MRLDEIREEIRRIDEEIMGCIIQRTNLAEKVSRIKEKEKFEIFDEEQNRIVLNRAMKKAAEEGLNVEKIEKIFKILIEMSIDKQRQFRGHVPKER
jgi:chorismate mutase